MDVHGNSAGLWVLPSLWEGGKELQEDHEETGDIRSSLLIVLCKFSVSALSFSAIQKVHHPFTLKMNLPILHFVVVIFYFMGFEVRFLGLY